MGKIYILNPYKTIGGGSISQLGLIQSLTNTKLFEEVVIFNAFSKIELIKYIYKIIIRLNSKNNDYVILQGLFEIEYFLFDIFAFNKKKIIIIPRGAYVPTSILSKIVKNSLSKRLLWKLFIKKRIKSCAFWAPTSDLEQIRLLKVGAYKKNSIIIPDYFNGNERFPEFTDSLMESKKRHTDYLLYVGRISIEKNILFLIDFFLEFSKKFINYKMIILGPIDDKIYFNELNKKIHELYLEDKIIFQFSCTKSELVNYYKNSNTVLLPSHIESLGLIVLEAIFFNKYIFISEHVPFDLNGSLIGETLKLDIDLWVNRVSSFILTKKNNHNLKNREKILNEYNLETISFLWNRSFTTLSKK
jgi:glycosyltransferase involved in cell wall biosynthesis